MIPRLVNAALGIWLIAAPAVLGYSTTASAASSVDRTVGPLVASAAIAAIWPEIRPLRWVNVVLGGWMVAAPLVLGWLVDYPAVAAANSVVVGVAVTRTGLVRGSVDARFGGGWRSVWRSDIDTTGR